MNNTKKIFLTIILSLAFVFGMFSHALAITVAEADVAYVNAVAAAQTTYNATLDYALAIMDAVSNAAEAAKTAALALPDTDHAHITAQATFDAANAAALATYNAAKATATVTRDAAIATALAIHDAAVPASPANNAAVPSDPTLVKLENPLEGNKTSATEIIATVVKTALGIIGALTLLMFVWGGFQWLTSAGNPEKVKSGAQTMVWAIIGVVLVFSSYLLLTTFTNILTGT